MNLKVLSTEICSSSQHLGALERVSADGFILITCFSAGLASVSKHALTTLSAHTMLHYSWL